MQALRQAWKNNDMNAVNHAAHALKSPSHQIGALPFKNILAAIERHAVKEESEPIIPLMDEVEAQFTAVKTALNHIMRSLA